MTLVLTDNVSNPAVFNTRSGEVVAMYVVCCFYFRNQTAHPAPTTSYDYETYAPPSSNGNGGLGFIGMQRCLDCGSSPIADLYSRWKAQGWASTSISSLALRRLSGFDCM